MGRLALFSLLFGGSCVLACSRPAPQPTEPSVSRLTTESIADRYIVVFKKGAMEDGMAGRSAPDVAASITGQYGGKVVHTYKHALQGAAMVLSPTAAEDLRRDSRVAYVEPDGMMAINAVESNATWGLDRVDQRQLPLNQTYVYPDQAGEGVHVYVIDTGVYAGHSEFAVTGGGSRVVPGYDFIDNDNNPDDGHGHGTHVAGTIGGKTYGLAKKVTLHSVRVLDQDGYGPNSVVIAGIDWVTANHTSPAVANMSLGGEYSQAVNDAVTNSIAAGVTYGIAAGNDSTDACDYSPASTPNAITVGATNASDLMAGFSNFGSCLDIFAPGEGITSAWKGGATATVTESGTSMATPHVVGSAALWLGLHPTATPTEVAAFLTLRATPDLISNLGDGSPNLLLYMANMVAPPTTPQVASMGATPSLVESGNAVNVTVRLTDVAPSGGITLALSSSHTAIVLPSNVFIPEGSQGASIPVTASPVSNPTVVTLSATYNAVTVTSTVTVLPSPTPASVTLSPWFVEGGATSIATVTLSGPAPAGGAVIDLSSSDTTVATVPATMTIPAGGTNGQVTVTSFRQSSTAYVRISATYHGLTRTSSGLSVRGTPAVSRVSVDPSTIEGGATATGQIALAYSAPAGGAAVTLSSSHPAANVPVSVTIAEGEAYADFAITTTQVDAQTSITITATYPAGYSKSGALTVLPSPILTSLEISPPTIWGGDSCYGTVTLGGPAPAAGVTITLASSDPSIATVPATLVVAAGESAGTFPIATEGEPTTQYARIFASLNGITVDNVLWVYDALPAGNAAYDATLRAPKCGSPAASCSSGRLLEGRGQLGPESNAPNTIGNSCSDGNGSGHYHLDIPSLDYLAISTVDGSTLAPGKQVRIDANVYTFQGDEGSYPTDDRLDLYLTTNATASPVTWTLLTPTPIIPPNGGPQALTHAFTLPAAGSYDLWAIRGNYRWTGSQAVCQPGLYDDYDDLIFAVEMAGPFNQAPAVNAGADQTLDSPGSAALAGTATDDGLPRPPATLTTTWSKVSGPGTVTFGNASALATTASFSTAGSYTLRLTASDSALSSSDDIVITVTPGNSPCTGICSSPTSFTINGTYQSGGLGTDAHCYETMSTIQGGTCSWFASRRTLMVNGTTESCNGRNWSTIPAKVNGGYCIQISAGNYASASFSAW